MKVLLGTILFLTAVSSVVGVSHIRVTPDSAANKTIGKPADNILDILKKNNLTWLVDLIGRAGLSTNLTSKGNFTVFAPIDLALDNLPIAVRERLISDAAFCLDFIEYHILPINLTTANFTQDKVVPALNKKKVRFNDYQVNKKSIVTVNGAVLIKKDIVASNGIIDIVDKALWPQTEHNVMDAISNITGLQQFASRIKESKIDLSGSGPYTVFAPSDDAFKKHSGASAKDITNYHVVPGAPTKYSAGLTDGQKLTTMYKHLVFKTKLTIKLQNFGTIVVEGTYSGKVITSDIPASNGVIYILDTVLGP